MLARVKVTDSRSGQDYLLFISKLNLKGLLVLSLPTLALESPVKLELSMGGRTGTLSLEGAIYKHIPMANGGKGTIVRFVGSGSKDGRKLEEFIRVYEESLKSSQKRPSKSTPSIEKTASFNENSLSHLALLSSDREAGFVASTMDEEEERQQAPGLSGHTIIANIKNAAARRDRSRTLRAAIIVGLALLSTAAWYFRASWSGPLKDRLARMRTAASKAPESASTQPNATNPALGASLASVSYDDSPNFVRVSLKGDGNFALHFISKRFEPKSLILDFPEIDTLTAGEKTPIDAFPIDAVEIVRQGKGLRVYFNFSKGSDFPKYEALPQPDGIDVRFFK